MFITESQLARLAGITRQRMHQIRKKQRAPTHIKVGTGLILYNKGAAQRWLKKRKGKT